MGGLGFEYLKYPKNLPLHLFKYFGPDRISFLEDHLIRFTQPEDLNDPFEFSMGTKNFFGKKAKNKLMEMLAEKLENPEELIGDIFQNKSMKATYNIDFALKQISENKASIMDNMMRDSENLFAPLQDIFPAAMMKIEMGVLSLSEKPDNPVMWSQYAKEYSGFVVVFDPFHEWFAGDNTKEDCNLWPVTYDDFIDDDMFDLIDNEINFLARKRTDWAHEKEWRLIRKLENADKRICSEMQYLDICLFEVPIDAVVGIIVGPKCTTELHTKAAIYTVTKNPNSMLHFLKPNKQNATFEIIDINKNKAH